MSESSHKSFGVQPPQKKKKKNSKEKYYFKSTWYSPYILVCMDPLLTYLLLSVPSMLTVRYMFHCESHVKASSDRIPSHQTPSSHHPIVWNFGWVYRDSHKGLEFRDAKPLPVASGRWGVIFGIPEPKNVLSSWWWLASWVGLPTINKLSLASCEVIPKKKMHQSVPIKGQNQLII